MISENVAIIIPALDPEEELIFYINDLIISGAKHIIVVNDGSSIQKQYIFEKISQNSECTLINHEKNMGKGKALKNALEYYSSNHLKKYPNLLGVITADSDGQHTVADVTKIAHVLVNTSAKNHSLVLGEREFDNNVPLRSKFGNICTRILFQLLYGIKLTDTQTGLRGIPNSLINQFKDLNGDRYEYEMNMLIKCSTNKIPIESVIIQTVYLNNNQSSHFNPLKDSFKIYKLLLTNFFKYMWVSITSFVIDFSLFEISILGLKNFSPTNYILIATILSRICSSLFNYSMNRKIVFKNNSHIKKTIFKYYLLAILQMLVSGITVSCFYHLIPFSEIVWKAIIDSILFFFSYHIQQNFIFINEEN